MRAGGFWINGAVAACTLCCVLASAQAASALEPGVHVDPGSPAAKEYALPLDQARQTGTESSSQPSSEGGLFGAGIKPPGSGGSSRGGGTGGGGTGSSATGGHRANGTGHAVPPAPGASATSPSQAQLAQAALRAAREQGSGGGNGSILALVGGGVAILVLGGFGGTVLRHSRRPRPTA
ncbi:MAG: hypothetical protein JWO21_1304 [Solirubrobacterales bacterium]|nr:hypothetical protein [Solirubrobacterales bacterium]